MPKNKIQIGKKDYQIGNENSFRVVFTIRTAKLQDIERTCIARFCNEIELVSTCAALEHYQDI